ncbi:hypothetical protein DFH27DRAFT_555920 [Peziza echinospora]|nr:hypothetical protein DFH27DRAFT_555920 [Peziza echinospora]
MSVYMITLSFLFFFFFFFISLFKCSLSDVVSNLASSRRLTVSFFLQISLCSLVFLFSFYGALFEEHNLLSTFLCSYRTFLK